MQKFIRSKLYLLLILFLGCGWYFAKLNPVRSVVIINDDTRSDTRVRVRSHTGNNRTDEGQVQTGNAGAGSVVVTDFVNTTVVNCCTTPAPTPTPDPGNPTITPTPDPGQPTATPMPTQPPTGGGGNGGGGSTSGGGIGGGDVQGAATLQERGEVLGLAATGSGVTSATFQGLGLLCLGTGLALKKRFAVS